MNRTQPLRSTGIEVLDKFYARVLFREKMLKRRSKGITDIRVRWTPQALYFHSGFAYNRKPEIEGMWKLDGQIDLIQLSEKTFYSLVTMPDGNVRELRVQTLGIGTVMISTPGSSWRLHGEVGKRNKQPGGENTSGSAPQSPSTYQWVLHREGDSEA